MSLTKKRFIYVLLVALLLLSLGLLYLALSGAKKPIPQEPKPGVTLQNLIPGESTKQDVIRIKGSPTLTSTAANLELLNYEVNQVEDSDVYAFSNNILQFYVNNLIEPALFNDFSKTRGKGTSYYENDPAFTWHIYPTQGVGVATIGGDIVKQLVFSPTNPSVFDESVGSFLGLSVEPPVEEFEAIPELE